MPRRSSRSAWNRTTRGASGVRRSKTAAIASASTPCRYDHVFEPATEDVLPARSATRSDSPVSMPRASRAPAPDGFHARGYADSIRLRTRQARCVRNLILRDRIGPGFQQEQEQVERFPGEMHRAAISRDAARIGVEPDSAKLVFHGVITCRGRQRAKCTRELSSARSSHLLWKCPRADTLLARDQSVSPAVDLHPQTMNGTGSHDHSPRCPPPSVPSVTI